MQPIFKFLPERFVGDLLQGRILFRNLVYFKRIERDPRADAFEGAHVDAPDNDVIIDNLTTGKRITGRFAFHNAIEHPEKIFCFCTSLRNDHGLFKYGEACVEIFDVPEFIRRLARELARRNRVQRLEQPYLQTGPVIYFDPARAAPPGVDILNARQLPFLKRTRYASDREFRFLFARRGGYKRKRELHIDRREIDESIDARHDDMQILRIGSITDIATQIGLNVDGHPGPRVTTPPPS